MTTTTAPLNINQTTTAAAATTTTYVLTAIIRGQPHHQHPNTLQATANHQSESTARLNTNQTDA